MCTLSIIASERNKNICHGFGCFNNATHTIEEDGYDGTLMLCDDCIAKIPKWETYEKIRGTRILKMDNNKTGNTHSIPN